MVFGFSRYIVGPKGLSKEQVGYWERMFADIIKTSESKSEVDRNNWESNYMTSADTEKGLKSQYTQLRTIFGDLGMAK